MRRLALLPCALVLACGGEKAPAADSVAAAPPAPMLNLADLAGTWNQQAMGEESDSVLVASVMTATADPASWTISLAGRPAIPIQVVVDGDSIMTTVGPYESVLMKGVQVTTNGVSRLVDGKLVGRAVAHYAGVTTADSVRQLRTVATKQP